MVVGRLLAELGPGYEIALYNLAEKLERRIPFTREAASYRLMRMESAAGGTPLYIGLSDVSKDFDPQRFGDTILLISDGVDTVSPRSKDLFEEALSSRGVRLLILRFPDTGSGASALLLSARAIRRIEAFGGVSIDLRNTEPEVVSAGLASLYDAVSHLYRLDVELGRKADKPRKWKLAVIQTDGKKLKDVEVAYPRLLVPLAEKK